MATLSRSLCILNASKSNQHLSTPITNLTPSTKHSKGPTIKQEKHDSGKLRSNRTANTISNTTNDICKKNTFDTIKRYVRGIGIKVQRSRLNKTSTNQFGLGVIQSHLILIYTASFRCWDSRRKSSNSRQRRNKIKSLGSSLCWFSILVTLFGVVTITTLFDSLQEVHASSYHTTSGTLEKGIFLRRPFSWKNSVNEVAFLFEKKNRQTLHSKLQTKNRNNDDNNKLNFRSPQARLQPELIAKESYSNNHKKMKAWTCHGKSQRELVDRLVQADIVRTKAVQQVLCLVDRKNYVPFTSTTSTLSSSSLPAQSCDPYQDTPQSIGLGQTISAPHMHAHALEEIIPYLFHDSGNDNNFAIKKILDVGCGSGYLTACFGRLFQSKKGVGAATEPNPDSTASSTRTAAVGDNQISLRSVIPFRGKVFGIDIQPQLVELAKLNIQKEDSDLLLPSQFQDPHKTDEIRDNATTMNSSSVVTLLNVNGWNGLPSEGPYDAIHVGAAAASFPYELAMQLKPGGVLVVPIGPVAGAQCLYKVERRARPPLETSPSSNPSNSSTRPSTFDPNEYQVTELLHVRYVPLIEGPSTSTTTQ